MIEYEGNRFTTQKTFQAHAHLRTGWQLLETLRHLCLYHSVIVLMPNIEERPLVTMEDFYWYRALVNAALEQLGYLGKVRVVYMMKLTPSTTPEMIYQFAAEPDIVAMKYYPEGATTNSIGGIPNLRDESLSEVLLAMQANKLVFSGHFENPNFPHLLREKMALPDLCWLVRNYPEMTIVMEHVSSQKGILTVLGLHNVYGSITIQHVLLTCNDLFGQPHNFCLPIAKHEDDRQMIERAALQALAGGKFFGADDSAIHPVHLKESRRGKAGVFNAPTAFPLWVTLYESKVEAEIARTLAGRERDPIADETLELSEAECSQVRWMVREMWAPRFEAFHRNIALKVYGLEMPNDDTVTMIRQTWTVPDSYANHMAIPFWSGKDIPWQLAPS